MRTVPGNIVSQENGLGFFGLDFRKLSLSSSEVLETRWNKVMPPNTEFLVGDVLRVVCDDGSFWACVGDADTEGGMKIIPDLVFPTVRRGRPPKTE